MAGGDGEGGIEGGRHNESCVGCLFVLKGCILPSPYFTIAVAAAEEEEGEADRLPLPAASHLASLSLSLPSPLSALPSCQRRLNLTQVRGGRRFHFSFPFLFLIPSIPKTAISFLCVHCIGRPPPSRPPRTGHTLAFAQVELAGEWMGEKYKANIGSATMDGPIGTEAIRRSFWNQREGQSISPAHGGAIFLCHKRCMAMLSEAFLPLFKWPARFTNNCVIPYLFPLISCLFPHLPLQEVSPYRQNV